MSEHEKVTAEDIRRSLDHMIECVKLVKDEITDENFLMFDVVSNQHRDLEHVYRIGEMNPVGMKQTSPMIYDFQIIDRRKMGKEL
jgi:heme oxygenase